MAAFPKYLVRTDLAPLFEQYLTGDGRYETLSDDAEYRTGLVQELRREQGAYRANSGEFVLERNWNHDEPQRPSSGIRLQNHINSLGPGAWATLTPEGIWEDNHLDDYRAILQKYRRWG